MHYFHKISLMCLLLNSATFLKAMTLGKEIIKETRGICFTPNKKPLFNRKQLAWYFSGPSKIHLLLSAYNQQDLALNKEFYKGILNYDTKRERKTPTEAFQIKSKKILVNFGSSLSFFGTAYALWKSRLSTNYSRLDELGTYVFALGGIYFAGSGLMKLSKNYWTSAIVRKRERRIEINKDARKLVKKAQLPIIKVKRATINPRQH